MSTLKAPSPQHPLKRYRFLKEYEPSCQEVKDLEYKYPHFRFKQGQCDITNAPKEPLMHKPIKKKNLFGKLIDWVMKDVTHG